MRSRRYGGTRVLGRELGFSSRNDPGLEAPHSLKRHFQGEPTELQIPFDFAQGRLSAALGQRNGDVLQF